MAVGERALWTKTNPGTNVPHRIDLVASSSPPADKLISCAFVPAISPRDEFLLTFDGRPDQGWDVPGGHLDPGEKPAAVAVRIGHTRDPLRLDPRSRYLGTS